MLISLSGVHVFLGCFAICPSCFKTISLELPNRLLIARGKPNVKGLNRVQPVRCGGFLFFGVWDYYKRIIGLETHLRSIEVRSVYINPIELGVVLRVRCFFLLLLRCSLFLYPFARPSPAPVPAPGLTIIPPRVRSVVD